MEVSIRDLAGMSRSEAQDAIRACVQTVPVGDGLVLARVLGHPKMFLHASDLGFSCHVMLDGYWEIWLTLAIARLLKPGMTAIDVGANFGYYSILMGFAVGGTGRVLSVEPNPAVATVLARSLRLNGLDGVCRLAQAAAWSSDGAMGHLYVPRREPKNASMMTDPFEDDNGATVAVPYATLDRLCADFRRVDLVKIDAEGAEGHVLEGLKGVIQRDRPDILLEFNAARYADPAGFLASLTTTYGRPRILDFEGAFQDVTDAMLIADKHAEDKLLYFSVT